MKSPTSRQSLLRQAFADIPAKVGDYPLRPLSGGSFELLGEIKNALVHQDSTKNGLADTLSAVHEYIWIHYAPIDKVSAVTSRDDIPRAEVRSIGFSLSIGESLEFTSTFMACALRMAAAMAEITEDEDSAPGKHQTLPTGSPPSSLPADAPETPSGNATSFGSHPSNDHSPTSTPPTSIPDLDADGAIPLITLPVLSSQTPPSSPSEPSAPSDSPET